MITIMISFTVFTCHNMILKQTPQNKVWHGVKWISNRILNNGFIGDLETWQLVR